MLFQAVKIAMKKNKARKADGKNREPSNKISLRTGKAIVKQRPYLLRFTKILKYGKNGEREETETQRPRVRNMLVLGMVRKLWLKKSEMKGK